MGDHVICGDCEEEPVYKCGIRGSDDYYLEEFCGRCGVPLCEHCSGNSQWTYDEHPCCRKCCSELDEEQT